jgi:hypothetical protein
MSEKQLVLLEPTYPSDVLTRQAVRAMAINARVTKMITNLEKQLKVIETGLASDPNELNLLKNQMEVENKLELARFELTDVVEVKTTAEEVHGLQQLLADLPQEDRSTGSQPGEDLFLGPGSMHNSPARQDEAGCRLAGRE